MAEAYLELGTNLGDREDYLARALALLEGTEGIRLVQISRVYCSKAWGVLEQPDFLNVCLQIDTMLQPLDLLAVCKDIENALGRQENNWSHSASALFTERPRPWLFSPQAAGSLDPPSRPGGDELKSPKLRKVKA